MALGDSPVGMLVNNNSILCLLWYIVHPFKHGMPQTRRTFWPMMQSWTSSTCQVPQKLTLWKVEQDINHHNKKYKIILLSSSDIEELNFLPIMWPNLYSMHFPKLTGPVLLHSIYLGRTHSVNQVKWYTVAIFLMVAFKLS